MYYTPCKRWKVSSDRDGNCKVVGNFFLEFCRYYFGTMVDMLFHKKDPKGVMNVSDQSSIFTHEIQMLISIYWKCLLAFNVLNVTKTDGWIQNFKKRDMIAKKRQYVYCAAVLYSDWSLQMDQMRPKMTLHCC